MATFFVGQRVRVTYVYQPEYAHLLGEEGRITEIMEAVFEGAPEPVYGLDINPIEYEEDPEDDDSFVIVGFGPEQLEPIQPSGHRAGDYSLSELLDRCRAGEGVCA